MVLELKAETREIIGKKVKKLRQAGQIPAVLYGHGLKSLSLTVRAKEFNQIFSQTGETSLVTLMVGGKKHNVLIHDFECDPLTSEILHVDFYEVKLDEKLKAKVPLVFIGESPAVKSEGGILLHGLSEVEVEALPQDLPKEISADISLLNTFEDKVRIKDLVMPAGVKILTEPEIIVASVAPPRSEKELAELEAKPLEAPEEVKVVGEEEKEKVAEMSEEPPLAAEQKTE